jgi:hypothetical protein
MSAAAPSKWRARWDAFRRPIAGEKADVLRQRWAELPAELRTPNQISGRHLTHCGFTLGASYCSFHCTHCYLPKNANEVPIPSLAQMKEQIDANRRFQGPGGGLQITGGDVADAYWRSGRQAELVEIVRYAYAVGLVPMVMTHGQTFIEHPEFLERLVVDGGLRQVAVHVDVTQAGRRGFPIGRIKTEARSASGARRFHRTRANHPPQNRCANGVRAQLHRHAAEPRTRAGDHPLVPR